MSFKKSVWVMSYSFLILLLISICYAADMSGTYTGVLMEDLHPTDIYIGQEHIGKYSDYRMYDVSFDKDQKIKVWVEMPSGADFDLFVFTQNETDGWGSYSGGVGEKEELNLTIPATGGYKFVVAAYSGGGKFTLRWETVGGGLSIPTELLYAIIGVVAVVVVVAIVFLLRRSRARRIPPPVQAPPPAPPSETLGEAQRQCPRCGGPLTLIKQYGRWYCYNCREYV